MSKSSMRRKILKILEVPHDKRETLSVLRNPDLLPIPRKEQTWGFWSNFSYWGIMSFCVGMWMCGSSALSVGMTYGQSLAAFTVGNVFTMMFTLANSYQGLNWKVGYTLSQRFVFGIYGSGVGILIRILMSIVNYGSSAWLGGLCVNLILDSWSHHYLHLPNTLPDNIAMTTKQVIGFMIFHVICAFTYLMKPYKMNYLLIWSSAACCLAMLGMVIYLTHKAGGPGTGFKDVKQTSHGSEFAWNFIYLVSYWYGSVSPGSTNQSDYSRFASSKRKIWLGTICALFIPTIIIPVFGIIGASTCQKLYNESYWMPMDICEKWLFDSYDPAGRAGVFFCGLAFTVSQIGYTVSSCGFASGMDLSGVLPKYIDIMRGALITAVISFACQPWNFYNSSSTFLTVMSAFGVVMTPIISVMICDNFLIRKQQYSVSQAFIVKGEYYYTKGVNWRAIFAWIAGMAPGLPGIAWQVNNNYFTNKGIVNFYYADNITSFLISFFTYWGLCLIFPVKIKIRHDDKDYYGAFTDEEARKKGMVPYSELSAEEIQKVFDSVSDDSTDTDETVVENEENDLKIKLDEEIHEVPEIESK
ncbi:probable Thiamine transporter [Saccharomycodes ludwigii]|uniref:Probable Thiamine transporter n=1 Tax=Saccharomycodes ludwigii TaxID=36035 RepID=A0A376BA22_9ASCO|nr:hypothetical protein SCDLUD_000019 [Saccharomycodes ludwigii]KAH3902442.1 hypothetical protein SCDLUD_000019 [Saccharomycodes ludwigii]SSD61502.1 probable Thiamine transporter [Saccharomycodes ludwigii]